MCLVTVNISIMCGIVVQVNRAERINRDLFKRMLDTLSLRGPDQDGIYTHNNVGLGQRRLSILDLSEAGRQPMFNEDHSISVVFNGEIYNYKEVISSLREKHTFLSSTDTEVLVHGYEEWGSSMVDRIEGMFAFVIYDQRNGILTVARDHFGKKPLYYYADEYVLCFASEIKALLQHPYIRSHVALDNLSLTKYLFYGYVPSPQSIFRSIKKLEPATVMQFNIGSWQWVKKQMYWHLEHIPLHTVYHEKEITEKTEELIKHAVKKRMMADVPLGVFLSGGVDSSLITAYLKDYSDNVNSFTICYKDSPEADESLYATKVADGLGINKNLCYFEDAAVKDTFIEMMNYLDEPMADPAIIPLYYVSKFAKQQITVVLSGDGGDELFGGYPKYKAQKAIYDFQFLSFLMQVGGRLVPRSSSYYKLIDGFNRRFAARQFMFGSGSFLVDDVKRLMRGMSIDLDAVFEEAIAYEQSYGYNDTINKSLYLDCKIQLPDWYLVKGDRATMATSLEMRNPLLDKQLAEFVFGLSGDWKIHQGKQKYLLKKIASKHIDHDIVYRKKSGFGVPLNKWINHELKELFNEYLYVSDDLFDNTYIASLHEEHIAGRADHRFMLLRIFNFNYWRKKYGGA